MKDDLKIVLELMRELRSREKPRYITITDLCPILEQIEEHCQFLTYIGNSPPDEDWEKVVIERLLEIESLAQFCKELLYIERPYGTWVNVHAGIIAGKKEAE